MFTGSSSGAAKKAEARGPAMTRGRRPDQALRLAAAIAENRGHVQHVTGPLLICSIVIYCAGRVAHIRVKRMRHIRCSPGQIEREAGGELAALLMIASSPAISRELWLCSPTGKFRFFQVTGAGLAELDRDGRPLPEEKSSVQQKKSSGKTDYGKIKPAPSVNHDTPASAVVEQPGCETPPAAP